MTAYTDELTEEFTAAQVAIEEKIMRDLVASKLTQAFQSEANIIRAVYGKTDSQISDTEWHEVIRILPFVGQSRNIGRNEYVWRSRSA